MATVFEARHIDLGKRVALKVLRPEYAVFPAVRARFLREGQAAARIQHQHVADVTDVCDDHGVVFLVMEFLEGEDLSKLLDREKKLSVEQAADLLVPVIAALATAHEAGVVHRDLKPSNVFLVRERYGAIVPKLLDFGISKIHDPDEDGDEGPELTHTETVLGTPYYMAPELVRGAKNCSAFSDQYALGVVFYRCLTGRFPFRGSTPFETMNAILGGTYRPLHEVVAGVDAHFESVVARAMHPEVAQRYPSLIAMGADFLRHASPLVQAQWAKFFGVTSIVGGALRSSLVPLARNDPAQLPAMSVIPIPAGDLFGAAAPSAGAVHEDPVLDVDPSETTGVRRGEAAARVELLPEKEPSATESAPESAPVTNEPLTGETIAETVGDVHTPPDPSLMFGTIFEMNVAASPEAREETPAEHASIADEEPEAEKTSVMPEHVPTTEFTDTTEPERSNVVVEPDLLEESTTRRASPFPQAPVLVEGDVVADGRTIPSIPTVIVERPSSPWKTLLGVAGLCLLGVLVGTAVYLRSRENPKPAVVQGVVQTPPTRTPPAPRPSTNTDSRATPPPTPPEPTRLQAPTPTPDTATADAGAHRSGGTRANPATPRVTRPNGTPTAPWRPPVAPRIERTPTGGAILR
jgi:serine/threonine-protein kinase